MIHIISKYFKNTNTRKESRKEIQREYAKTEKLLKGRSMWSL